MKKLLKKLWDKFMKWYMEDDTITCPSVTKATETIQKEIVVTIPVSDMKPETKKKFLNKAKKEMKKAGKKSEKKKTSKKKEKK